MKGFVQDIENLAVRNDEFRRVLYTAAHGISMERRRNRVTRKPEGSVTVIEVATFVPRWHARGASEPWREVRGGGATGVSSERSRAARLR